MKTINEYHVFGLGRSGHHAIAWWIRSHVGDHLWINNIQPHMIKDYSSDKKRPLVWNLEDRPIEYVREVSTWVPGHNIVVVRDAFNWLASCVKKGVPEERMKYLVPRWKGYAQGLLDNNDGLCYIYFDRWFVDRDYRRQIIENLGLTFTDDGLEYMDVPSSFDDMAFQGRAQQMNVLDRHTELDTSVWVDEETRQISRRLSR